MKKFILLVLIAFTFTFGSATEDIINQKAQQKTELICGISHQETLQIKRRGCCSWHGGVVGCGTNGRVMCRDGTYSPTCTCAIPVIPSV